MHKLRAICLLEADFNWWNKLIFAKQMMKQAGQEGCIPQECFAKKHSHCNYALLTKQFFCDSSRSLHYPAGLGECNFRDCYDRAAHPPTSIALQSWGIPASAIRILLTSMQWPPSTTTEPKELIQYVQQATTNWGKLAQASGGILKAGKCSVYFLDYKFVCGRAQTKSLQDLPKPTRLIEHEGSLLPSHISIPQPDGTNAYIVTHDVTTASKVLGINFTPAGNSIAHVESCVQKGLD